MARHQSSSGASSGRKRMPPPMSASRGTASEATHGKPEAWASIRTMPRPSCREGRTNTSAAERKAGTSALSPRKRTLSSIPRSRTRERTSASNSPVPTSKSRARGSCCRSCAKIPTRRSWFFCGANLPTCNRTKQSSKRWRARMAARRAGSKAKRSTGMALRTSRKRGDATARPKTYRPAISLHANQSVASAVVSRPYNRISHFFGPRNARQSWLWAIRTWTPHDHAARSCTKDLLVWWTWTMG